MSLTAGVGKSLERNSFAAGAEAARSARRTIDGESVDIALVFGTAPHDQERLLAGVREELPDAQIAGCSGEGVIAGDRSEEAVGRLAGGVAHDFNNLLTVVLGHAQLLELALPEGSSERADVQQIVDAGERAADIARQLLTFSRRQPRRLEVLDVNELVTALSRMLERVLGETVSLALRLDSSVGRLRGDRAQLEQALLNLVVNARDAMPEGGRLTIEARPATAGELEAVGLQEARGRWLAPSVTDTGAGMSEDLRRQAREPFFTTKDQRQGTGLGLAMVHGVVTQAGGRLRLESESGQGATATMLLATVTAEADPLPTREAPVASEGRRRATVLIVEDEPSIRTLALRVLREEGHELLEATDGETALALLGGGERRIDLLLTDVVMPRLGGPELVARLRESQPDFVALFMTGYAKDGLAARGLHVDDADRLHEPFRPDELVDRVRTKLRARRLASGQP